MGKYLLLICFFAVAVFIYLVVIIQNGSNITKGQITKGMKIGTMHEIDTQDGKVVIGSKDSKTLKPQIKLSKLDDEAYLTISHDIKSDQINTADKTITWKGNNSQDLFFKQPTSDTFEFDITLLKKPASNIFTYSIDSKNLDFFYQPPLTEKEIERGNIRPENVEGSYAVYYKNGLSGDYSHAGGKNYKTGKAFHIYRPKIMDANGKSVWGELSINTKTNKLLVKVPQEFLDTGIYPITVDPTFGYTSQGASDAVLCGSSGDYKVAMRADSIAGTLTNISAYIKNQLGTSNINYRTEEFPDSSSKPGTAEAQGSPNAFLNPSYQLVSDSFSFSMSDGIHWVGIGGIKVGVDNCRVAYDTGGTSGYGASTNDVGAWSTDSNQYSVYATYTAASPTDTPTPTLSPTPTPVFQGPKSAGTVVDDAAVGTVSWVNPANATASDNVYATATAPSTSLESTHYLKATNFGFNIPTNATINGINVEIERRKETFFQCVDNEIKIVKSDGSIGTTNKSAGASWSSSDTYDSFGGATDLWGESWTASDINDTDFGVVISPQIRMNPDGNPASVDHIRITVYYTPPPATNLKGNMNLKGNIKFKSN